MDKVRCFLHRGFLWVWPTECRQERPHRDSRLGSSFSLMRRNPPGPRASVCGIRQSLGAPRILRIVGIIILGQGRLALLGSTRVDVFPIHGVFHERNVVIGGQGEMRDAAHEASHVLSVRVQSNFLHSPCQEARGRCVSRRGGCLFRTRECLLTKASLGWQDK